MVAFLDRSLCISLESFSSLRSAGGPDERKQPRPIPKLKKIGYGSHFSYPSRVDCLKHISLTRWIEQVGYDPGVIWTGASSDSIEQGRQISHRSYNNILSTDGSKEMIMRAKIC